MSDDNASSTPSGAVAWGKPQSLKVRQPPLSKSGFTSAGNNAVMLFDALKAELNGENGGLHAAATTSLQLPVAADLKKGFLGFLIHVRGAMTVSAGGRVSLIVTVNGRAEVAKLNWVEGNAADTPFLHEQFVVEQRGAAETNPNVPPLEPLLITFTLVAKRSSVRELALIAVDDLSVLACFG